MATSTDYSRSVIAASEMKDIYCEPCVNDGKHIEAEGFCVDCFEYLCGQCYKNHTRYKAFRHHVLQDKDKMPVDTAKAGARDVCQEKCGLHPTKIIEYFCKSCDMLGCHACITVNHRQCENVDHIPNIAKDTQQSEELKEFIDELDYNLEAINERKKKISSNITETDEMKRKARADLKKQRDEINTFFDHLEAEMERRIEDIDKRNKKILKTSTFALDSIGDDLKQVKTTIDTKQKNGQNCELFIAIKNYKQKMETVNKEFEKLDDGNKIQRYALTPSTKIKEVLKNTTEICRLTTAKFVSKININTDNDNDKGSVCGLAVVQKHYLAVLDDNNKSVKVIDVRNMTVTNEMKIECCSIHKITKVNNDQIAVTILSSNFQGKIQFLSVSMSGSLSKGHQIAADTFYIGLTYSRGNFFMSSLGKVRITDMQGKTLKTINTVVDIADSIAVSPHNETIYLASCSKNTVTSMTLDGKIKAIYKDNALKSPYGVTVDSEGLVYVLSSGNTHQLTGDCNKIQTLLEDVYATEITFSHTDNRLYISLGSEIEVYQIE
ncbi:uncharacterized protein LOC128557615 [Mercenaria mercenaria]|uniref:uncharacterized protein LOC128557615 n=1 Tax=Mercenaria mercenaria TaxID=6596 RepID=UPI00234EDB85|nr:uncharacterized protein LOC128557615 [Mercenaria mercenaria]